MKRILLLSLLLCGAAYADNIKIGIVDLQKILQTSAEARAIEENLITEFQPRRDNIISQENEIKREMERFKRDSSIMSQSERKSLEKRIIQAQRKFEQEGQLYQQEISKAHEIAREKISSKIRKAIAIIAERDKYDVVIQKDATPFSAEKLDITKKVLNEMSS